MKELFEVHFPAGTPMTEVSAINVRATNSDK
jgi:hypothetical protein